MISTVQAVLQAVAGWAAFVAASMPGAPPRPYGRRFPYATVATFIVVAIPSVLQLTVAPWLLEALRRAPGELADGQLWRLVTSLVVQDGGLAGTVSNLVLLAFVGVVAEGVWGGRRWVGILLVAGVGSQLWGLVVQPYGAGNSVATLGLAASLGVVAIESGRGPSRVMGALSLLAGAVLIGLGDIHGGAVALGAATAAVLRHPPSEL